MGARRGFEVDANVSQLPNLSRYGPDRNKWLGPYSVDTPAYLTGEACFPRRRCPRLLILAGTALSHTRELCSTAACDTVAAP